MDSFLDWCAANPVLVGVIVTALVSLAQSQIAPRFPRLWSALQALGVDVPGFVRALTTKRLPPGSK